MPPVLKTTHAAEAKANLIELFKNRPNWASLLEAIAAQFQQLEEVFFELINDRFLDDAVGAQLDGMGQIVGRARNGLDDEAYRTRIRAQIRINLSSGTIPDLVEILELVLPSGQFFQLYEDSFPAHFEVFIPDPIEDLPARVQAANSEPFALAGGQTLTVEVDGGGAQTINFDSANFVSIGEATAEEVAAEINRQLSGGAAVFFDGTVAIQSNTLGTASIIQVTGGTANAALVFDTDEHTGPEANQAFMITVSNVLTKARAAGVRGILIWNTSSASFGFFGTPGALGFTEGAFASALDR
jgi:hypothetical protein